MMSRAGASVNCAVQKFDKESCVYCRKSERLVIAAFRDGRETIRLAARQIEDNFMLERQSQFGEDECGKYNPRWACHGNYVDRDETAKTKNSPRVLCSQEKNLVTSTDDDTEKINRSDSD
ncbi:hypothetical protein QAD02_007216 [Eretmocerus hayati]|uniref:Uncharacterized protein n=1 Tax=Eretmocerus hayati TaxID=131215 RepID=A0ACC2N5E0_9HYME|nr:hypothetical protein QAD02_007216 [Eretmocerus hayati]